MTHGGYSVQTGDRDLLRAVARLELGLDLVQYLDLYHALQHKNAKARIWPQLLDFVPSRSVGIWALRAPVEAKSGGKVLISYELRDA